MPFELTSPAFGDGEPIPDRHAMEGDNRSPALSWSDPPEGTKGLILIVEDPDAPGGTFHHWIVRDIAADIRALSENAGRAGSELVMGRNDFGDIAYDGPRPPQGHGYHRYIFRLAALDTELRLPTGAIGPDVWEAAEGHVLEEARLTGIYERT